MYIVFEGIDTCGKSTQINLLRDVYPQAIFTKEPGGSLLGEKIRSMILEGNNLDSKTELFLFLADRAQHRKEVIEPNLDQMIISDRSLISGIAYAMDVVQVFEMNLLAMNDILPDKIVFFEISESLLFSRLSKKNQDNIEKRGIKYFLKIQENLKKTLQILEKPTLFLDAQESIQDLHIKICRFLAE